MFQPSALLQDVYKRQGIYVTGFYYPVVPKGQARIRVPLSAGHEKAHLDKAIAAFISVTGCWLPVLTSNQLRARFVL